LLLIWRLGHNDNSDLKNIFMLQRYKFIYSAPSKEMLFGFLFSGIETVKTV
jgi:hypothetical protein